MEKTTCGTCQKPKATLECGLCHDPLCKSCAHFMDEASFSYDPKTSDDLKHSTYCNPCYISKVEGELEAYNAMLEKAKDVHVFEKDQGKETRFFKRHEKPFKVEKCADREETLMKLAFLAAQGDFNTLIDVDVVSEKIKSGGTYQTHTWKGSGIPTHVEERRLNRTSRLKSPSR